MIAHSIYETDNRVIRYANALAERGDDVEVFALKRDKSLADVEMVGKVRVNRLQLRSRKDQHGRGAYLFPLLRFWLLSSLKVTWRHLWRPYDAIHVHNVPDFLVFAAWLPRLSGAKVILDIHDMVPEFYASKFHVEPDALGVKMLTRVERASAMFSDHVIISNHLWHKAFISRSAHEGKCSVYINRVDSKVFYNRGPTRNDGKLIIMFPGGLQWHQGLDIAIKAFAQLTDKLPQAEFHIYGDGNMKNDLIALTKELGLTQKVLFFDPLPAMQIAQVMANADLGVVPKRADSFGNEAYSTKIMEFMSVGVPVVVSSTKIDRFYFNDSVVRFFESGNVDALAQSHAPKSPANEALRRELIARASGIRRRKTVGSAQGGLSATGRFALFRQPQLTRSVRAALIPTLMPKPRVDRLLTMCLFQPLQRTGAGEPQVPILMYHSISDSARSEKCRRIIARPRIPGFSPSTWRCCGRKAAR